MPTLSLNHRRAVARIDRERTALHNVTLRRLRATERRREPLADAMARPAMIAYLRGLRRAVLDANAATGVDVRVAHLNLSRADDERKKKDRELLLWLIAFLGLPAASVELVRQRAIRVAARAGDELERVRVNAAHVRHLKDETARTASKTPVVSGQGDNYHPAPRGDVKGQHDVPRIASGSGGDEAGVRRVQGQSTGPAVGTADSAIDRLRSGRHAGSPSEVVRRSPGSVSAPDLDVFGRFGKANVRLPDHLLDTWAETVAYSQYEAGRWDAANVFPAYSEMLYGHRWSSILDSRTTLGCRELDGWVAPLEDTRMQALRPPRHWGCRAVLVEVWQSSRLKKPTPQNAPSNATFDRLLAEKEEFMRRVA